MPDSNLLHVAMGEIKVGRRAEVLTALLGSCVAIGVIWPKGECCALAHCLLPESPAPTIRIGARYVNQAVDSLVALLGLGAADKDDIEVLLVGGARMLASAPISNAVGIQNIAAAHHHLERHGLRITHVDTGGRRGRRINIDCARGSFTIIKVIPEGEDHYAHA